MSRQVTVRDFPISKDIAGVDMRLTSKDDLWYFPKGNPHSIQGLARDGCEFLLVFDDGAFSEADTTLISDWTRHTPREVLAKNWGHPLASARYFTRELKSAITAGSNLKRRS